MKRKRKRTKRKRTAPTNRRSCASRMKIRALGVSLIGAAGADLMLLALADKSASLQLRLGLAAPAFLGKRLFGAGADPARVAAGRFQGQRLTENDREVSRQPLTA